MRWLLFLGFLACDHRPAERTQAPPPVATGDAAAVAPPVGDDPCMQVGVNVAEVIIASVTDPTQKAAYEQERTKMVKRFSDNCRREKWPPNIQGCFLAAKTQAAIDACSRDLATVNAPPSPPPVGSGSGAM